MITRKIFNVKRNIKETIRDSWRENKTYIFEFYEVEEFFTAWIVLLFISLVVAPLVFLFMIGLLPVYLLTALLPKRESVKNTEKRKHPEKKKC